MSCRWFGCDSDNSFLPSTTVNYPHFTSSWSADHVHLDRTDAIAHPHPHLQNSVNAKLLAYFQQPLTGEERGLVGYWNFDGDSVNGDTVKDLAAGDDNLNLDFKLSDIDSYLRGDGKITFLGESIDVYVEAGSDGLEFAMATDNGTLSTDLAIVLDQSGFAASGSVDLNIKEDINLPFGLGKISLVNLEVNTDASISVDKSGFASSFDGSVTINGKSISFSIDIDVAFSSVEDLYNQLEAKIIQEIKDSAKDVFSNVAEWANAIANGTVEFAGDVAAVASGAYNATSDAAIAAYKTVGKTAEEAIDGVQNVYNTSVDSITSGLKSSYNLGTDAMVDVLKHGGYGVTDVAKGLNNAYSMTDAALTDTLKKAGYGVNDTIKAFKALDKSANSAISNVKSYFGTNIDDMAKGLSAANYNDAQAVSQILKSSYGADARELGRALSGAYTSLSNDDLANILEDNGFNLDSVGRFFKKDLGLSKSNAKSALKSAFRNGRVNDWIKDVWGTIESIFS